MKNQQTTTQLKDKVDALEQTLLAIDNLNHLCQAHIGTGMEPLEAAASVLNYLIEPALFQVEALRMMIDDLQSSEKHKDSEKPAHH